MRKDFWPENHTLCRKYLTLPSSFKRGGISGIGGIGIGGIGIRGPQQKLECTKVISRRQDIKGDISDEVLKQIIFQTKGREVK